MHDIRQKQDMWPDTLLLVDDLLKTIPDLNFLSIETSMWLFDPTYSCISVASDQKIYQDIDLWQVLHRAAPILLLNGVPAWIATVEENDHNSPLFNSCYSTQRKGLELHDLCIGAIAYGQPNVVWTAGGLSFFHGMMDRFFEQQKASVDAKLLIRGIAALCVSLFNFPGGQDHELNHWRGILHSLSLPDDASDVDLWKLGFLHHSSKWFEVQFLSNPHWQVNEKLIRQLQNRGEFPWDCSEQFELLLAEDPIFGENHDWLLKTISKNLLSTISPSVFASDPPTVSATLMQKLLQLARDKGLLSRIVPKHKHFPSVNPYEMPLLPLFESDTTPGKSVAQSALRLFCQVFENAYESITFELLNELYEQGENFNQLGEMLQAYREAFAQIAPGSVENMDQKCSILLWSTVFATAGCVVRPESQRLAAHELQPLQDPVALEGLVQAARAACMPGAIYRDILTSSEETFCKHHRLFNYDLDSAVLLRQAWAQTSQISK